VINWPRSSSDDRRKNYQLNSTNDGRRFIKVQLPSIPLLNEVDNAFRGDRRAVTKLSPEFGTRFQRKVGLPLF